MGVASKIKTHFALVKLIFKTTDKDADNDSAISLDQFILVFRVQVS